MGIFSSAVARVRGFFDSGAQQSAGGLLAGVLQGVTAPRRGTRELLDAYRTSPWLRMVLWKVAMAVAEVELELYRSKRSGAMPTKTHTRGAVTYVPRDHVEVEAHPLLDLLRSPNPVMTRKTFFALLSSYLDMKGEAFVVVERAGSGLPAELWVVPPHWCTSTPTKAWPMYRFQQGAWVRSVPEADVLVLRHPDLTNPFVRGVGLGEAAADELDIDEFATQHLKSWFFNRALPDAFLSVEGVESPEEAKRYQEQLRAKHGGVGRGFQLHVTSGKVDLKQISHSFKDQMLPELRTQQRDTVLQLWNVPPEIVGIVENSNRATIDAAEVIFSRFTVSPRAAFIADAFTHWARQQYNDASLCIGFESIVPADHAFSLQVMTAQPSLFTKNEWRELAGRAPVPGWDVQFAERAPVGIGAPDAQQLPAGDPPAPPEDDGADAEAEDDTAERAAGRFLRLAAARAD